ncbi:MAG: ABC transporter substrate-binding protein [Clostridia bacterium]
MKKILSLLICLVMLMTTGAALAQADAPVTVTLWHRWSGANEQALNDVIADFNKVNPNITIEVTAKPGEYIELLQKMIADLAAGIQPPDLFIGGYNLLGYISNELSPNPVDTLAPSAEAYEALKAKFDAPIYALSEVDGVQVGVPYALSNIVTFYNKDLFAAAGLTDADVPTTWDEMATVGQTIKEKTGKFAVGIQKVDSWPDLSLIYSNGGKLLSDDASQVAFNNPEAVEAITMWQSLHTSGLAPICTDAELGASFLAGDVAMYCSSVMKLASIRESVSFEMGVAKFPAFGEKPLALPAGGAAIISFTGEDQAKRDAVWKFIDFATEPEAMATFTQTGYLCVTKAEVPMAEGQAVAYEQLPFAVQWTAWPGGSAGLEIDTLYINTRMSLIHEGGDILAAFDKLVADCNKLL